VPVLRYETLEGEGPGEVSLLFTLDAENPSGEAAELRITDWGASLNGRSLSRDGEAELRVGDQGAPQDGSLPALAAGETRSFPLRLNLNLEALLGEAAPETREGEAALDLELRYSYPGSGAPEAGALRIRLRREARFPLIREPRFSIRSIGVKRAELINTRFLVTISVDNPNAFPVALSAFSYELYNRGRFWAGGTMERVLDVPAASSAEAELALVMNFINMNRGLLDEIAALRQVDYRFTGTALVNTGFAFLPHFRWTYDSSGSTLVTE
jgi:LEA14-like dessication related protein